MRGDMKRVSFWEGFYYGLVCGGGAMWIVLYALWGIKAS